MSKVKLELVNNRHRPAKLRCRDTSFREHNNNPDAAFSIIQRKRAEAQRPNARDVVSNNGCFYNGAFIISLEYNRRNNHGSSYPPVMTIMRLFVYAKWVPRDTDGIRHLTGLPFQALVERS
jgi:hypothetical protein